MPDSGFFSYRFGQIPLAWEWSMRNLINPRATWTFSEANYFWWSWVLFSALHGLATGGLRRLYPIAEGKFGVKQIFFFGAVQVAVHFLLLDLINPVLYRLFSDGAPMYYTLLAFGNYLMISNMYMLSIIGLPLVFIYARVKKSLQQNDTS
jgi:hypothetical protein